ncbi:hypothetical protein F4802DRAFT_572512 [Xylaria palmicola]|nr:hypothetical protein F4802DRAFT_572512 [Xylaria palmicola]
MGVTGVRNGLQWLGWCWLCVLFFRPSHGLVSVYTCFVYRFETGSNAMGFVTCSVLSSLRLVHSGPCRLQLTRSCEKW